MHKLRTSTRLAVGAVAVAAPFAVAAGAQAHAAPHTLYVSTHAHSYAADRNCGTAAFNSIGDAVNAAPSGGTVVVCGGTYHEGVVLAKTLTLKGQQGATIDATGRNTGIMVTASHSGISGLTVKNAVGEGVLINAADYVTVSRNVVTDNDLGGLPVNPVPNTYPECQAQGGIPGDCGEGIHLMGSSHDTISGNTSRGNSGGILVSDETGPAAHNRLVGNVVTGNLYDCGITVVGHNPGAAPGGVPAPSVAGVYGNEVIGNWISGNGTLGEGAGVVMATPFPGGAVYDNVVEGNNITGNGMSGVSVHSHAPGQDLNGNVVRGNVIGTNNLKGDFDFSPSVDPQTTGVLVATVSPLSITVTGNLIHDDHFGLWTTGPVTVSGANANAFVNVAVHISVN